jgi:hypothetical protein
MKTTTTNTPETNVKMAQTLILKREDMVDSQYNKELSLIEHGDFKVSSSIQHFDIVLFIDNDGQTKFLKNRFNFN